MTNKSKKLRNTKMSKKSRKTRGGSDSLFSWVSNKAENAKENISNKYKDVKDDYNESTFGSDAVNKIWDTLTRKKSKQIDAIINLIKNAKKLGERINSDILPDLPNNLIDLIKTDGNLKVLRQATEYWDEQDLKIIIGEIIDNFPEPAWEKKRKTHLKILVIIVLIDKRPLILNDQHRLKFISEIKEQSIDVFQEAGTLGNKQYDYLKDILKNKMVPPIKFPSFDFETTEDKDGKKIYYIEGKNGIMLQTPHAIIDDVLGKELIINYIKKQTGERTEGGKSSKTRRKSNKKRSTKRSRK